MNKNVIIVDEEDRNIVQRADVECSARMNLILFLMNHDIDVNNNRFIEYNNDYTKCFEIFEEAKSNLQRKYLSGKNAISWNLNYQTCELTYET